MDHDEDEDKILTAFFDDVTVVLSDGTKVTGNRAVNDGHDAGSYVLDQAGMADNAETWLNEHVAPEGYYFGWEDGEFFLSPIPEED